MTCRYTYPTLVFLLLRSFLPSPLRPRKSLFGDCEFVRHLIASPGADTEKSDRVADSLFGHHLESSEISRRYPPVRPTYSPPSIFEMSQVTLTYHFLRVILSNNKVRIPFYRGVSFISFYIASCTQC